MMKNNSKNYEKSDIHFCRTCCIGRFFLHKGNAYVHPNL